MRSTVKIPETTAPIKSATSLLPATIKLTTTPGKTACAKASPMSDILRSIIYVPISPQLIPIVTEAISALCMNSYCTGSSKNFENRSNLVYSLQLIVYSYFFLIFFLLVLIIAVVSLISSMHSMVID